MLTKPISLSPSGETISVDDGIITLTAQLPRSCQLETFEVDGAEYCYATLILHTNNYDYTFEPDVTFPTIIKHKHYNSVQIKLITEKNFRCVRWGSRSGAQKTIYLKDILRSNDTLIDFVRNGVSLSNTTIIGTISSVMSTFSNAVILYAVKGYLSKSGLENSVGYDSRTNTIATERTNITRMENHTEV